MQFLIIFTIVGEDPNDNHLFTTLKSGVQFVIFGSHSICLASYIIFLLSYINHEPGFAFSLKVEVVLNEPIGIALPQFDDMSDYCYMALNSTSGYGSRLFANHIQPTT
jgi:hypothetical protein